jgi:molybdopterin-binding protein
LIKRLQLVHIRIFLLLNLITIRWVETAKVKVEVKMPVTVTVVITKESVEDLDINIGDEVEAIMKKSTEVMIDK